MIINNSKAIEFKNLLLIAITEKKIRKELNCTKIKAKDACGDIRSTTGKNIEVKVSILTLINSALNLVQIRLFHNVDYYLCVAYDG